MKNEGKNLGLNMLSQKRTKETKINTEPADQNPFPSFASVQPLFSGSIVHYAENTHLFTLTALMRPP